MRQAFESQTSATLLGKLRHVPTDPAAWNEFVERYGRKIFAWCRSWHLQEADAQDVTQSVLLKLAEKLRSFEYDPTLSFHGWLKTLAHHAWRDFVEAERRQSTHLGGEDVMEMLGSLRARDDLAERLAEEYDRERLEAAMFRVQLRVSEHTWQAFRELAIEGRTGAEVAVTLGISVSAAFMAKSRVQAMIRREIERVEKGNAR